MIPADLTENLCQQGYALIPDFLARADFDKLQQLAKTLHQDGEYRQAKIGKQERQQSNQNIRSDKIHWLDVNSPYPELQPYFRGLDALSKELNQTLFLGLNEYECHFAVYPPGSYYKRHSDQFLGGNERRISLVYYLNENWQAEDGGALVLYDDQGEQLKTILPEGNQLLCFRSDLPHEVLITHRLRYSLTAWLRVRSLERTIPMVFRNKMIP